MGCGSWLDPFPALRIKLETAGTLLSINPTESGRWSLRAFATRVSFSAPAYRPVFWKGTTRRRSWLPSWATAPPHTPGILYEYQNKGVAKLAFRKPLILKDAFSVACNS